MKFQPFRCNILEQGTEVMDTYEFIVQGNNPKPYKVTIVVDELDDNKIVSKTCECPHYVFRLLKCKHIDRALDILHEYNIELDDSQQALTREIEGGGDAPFIPVDNNEVKNG